MMFICSAVTIRLSLGHADCKCFVYMQNFPKAMTLCDAAENGHVDCIEVLHSLGVSLDEQKVIFEPM